MELRKIEKREYHKDKRANNYYEITCPFCQAITVAQVRGYHSRGRRCECCKALFKEDIAKREED